MHSRWVACALVLASCETPVTGGDASPTVDGGRDAAVIVDGAVSIDGGSDAGSDAFVGVDASHFRDLGSDRTRFFGDSRCTSDVLFCEDFEAATISTSRWTPHGTAPMLDTVHAARGHQAMHFHTATNGQSRLSTDDIFPVAGGRYWGRIFVWLDSVPTAPDYAHWTLVGAAGDTHAGEIRVGGQYDRTRNRFGVGTDGGDTGDWTTLDGDPTGHVVPAATGQWVCLEWMHDTANEETRFFWDGTEHPSLHTTATMHGGSTAQYLLPDFRSVWIGWWLYQAGSTPDHFDVWIDEVVLDDERIGCVI